MCRYGPERMGVWPGPCGWRAGANGRGSRAWWQQQLVGRRGVARAPIGLTGLLCLVHWLHGALVCQGGCAGERGVGGQQRAASTAVTACRHVWPAVVLSVGGGHNRWGMQVVTPG